MHGSGLDESRLPAVRLGVALATLTCALTPPAGAGAAIVPDGGDTRATAAAIESLPSGASELVDRPGDEDWYSIAGRNGDDSVNTAFVRVLRGVPGCDALTISLRNPEGRWMRTSTAAAGDVATILVPGLPSRYALAVRAADASCAGLEYEVTHVSTDPPRPDGAASRCLVARTKRADAGRRLRTLEIRRGRVTAAARPRYDTYVVKAKRVLAGARGDEARLCRTSA